MRIRLSGAVGGVVLVVITGVILASIVDGILSFIEKYVVKEDESGKKFISRECELFSVNSILL